MPIFENRYENPALIIVDMQNDFVRSGAPLEVPDSRDTIPAHNNLIAVFREYQLPIVYTKFLSTQYRSLIWNWSPECEPKEKCCWKGHYRLYGDRTERLECSDIIEEIYPNPKDLVIEKYGYGAFHGTTLDYILRTHQVRSLVITGTVTQICVEETGRQAFHHGYKTTLVSDAVSSYAPDLHAASLKNFAMKFGWVEPNTDVVAKIKEG